MFVLSGYGEIPTDANLTKDGIYTIQVGFIGKQPSMSKIKDIFGSLSAFADLQEISSPNFQYKYNIIFKFKKASYPLSKFIGLFEMQAADYRGKVYDFFSEAKAISKQEINVGASFAPAVDVVTAPVKAVYNVAESGVKTIGSYLPSLNTLKWIGIAAGAGIVLFYVGPLLRAGGTMASRIVERIPEKRS